MAPDINHATNVGYEPLPTSLKRRQSLELMNPPPNSPLRKTSFVSGTFNLVATIVGGGVLSLPLAFAKVGIILGTIMMVFSAVVTDFSLYLLCCCARRTGSTTYIDVVRFAFGPIAEICITAILWTYLSGVLIAFNVLLKGIFAPLARSFVSNYTSINLNTEGNFDALVLLIILLLVSPLTLKRNLYALRHICYVGFASVCVIATSIGIRAYQRNKSYHSGELDSLKTSSNPAGLDDIDMQIKYFTTDWRDVLFAFPIIVLAFLCAFNMVEVHCALEDPTRKRVKKAIHSSIASCFVLFQVFGLAGYFYAYDACRGNIFLNFDPSDPLIIVGRLGMGLTLMFGLPLSILPCREAFLSLIQQLGRFWNDSREPANIVEDSESDASIVMTPDTTLLTRKSMETSYSSFASAEIDVKSDIDNVERSSTGSLPSFTSTELVPGFDVEKNEEHELQPDVNPHDRNTAVHVGTTIAMTIFSFFGAVSVPGVAVVWCILGSSLGMFIAFIFPCACYLKIRGGKGMGRRTNAGALALLIFSIVISVVCTTQTILGILSKDD